MTTTTTTTTTTLDPRKPKFQADPKKEIRSTTTTNNSKEVHKNRQLGDGVKLLGYVWVVCIIITISGNEETPQTSEQKTMCCFQFPPHPNWIVLSYHLWAFHAMSATVYSPSSSSSLSLSTLVQRISKSSLNPRGSLTKTLVVLANPRGPDKPRCPG